MTKALHKTITRKHKKKQTIKNTTFFSQRWIYNMLTRRSRLIRKLEKNQVYKISKRGFRD